MSKPKNVQIVINDVPEELVSKIEEIAKREGRSRSAQVRKFLERVVAEAEGAEAQPKAA